jgi:site-specific recombinase XerD
MDHATPFELEHHGSLDVLQLAYAGYLARCRSANTLATYESALRRFMHWCVAQQLHPLYDVKRAHVEFYVRHLSESGLKASTVNTMMTPVKGFYDFALWEEYIDRDPARRVNLPRYQYSKTAIVSNRDLTIFLETAKATSPRHHALVSLLHQMGMRISEAAGLRIEGYTGFTDAAPSIRFIEKGGNERETPVPMSVLHALEAVRAGREEGPMIPRRDGGQLSRAGAAGLVETVNRRAMKAGLKRHINPHLLRKMAVTEALEMNMSIRDVQEFARHADPRTTSRHYDLGRANSYRHPVHQIAARLAV